MVLGKLINSIEQLILSMGNARKTATECIRRAQKRYKYQYGKKATPNSCLIREWVPIKFPQDETGEQRKLSRPWRGQYRILEISGTDITALKVYFPDEGQIQVQQSSMCKCPVGFSAGYYWYGRKRACLGGPQMSSGYIGLL